MSKGVIALKAHVDLLAYFLIAELPGDPHSAAGGPRRGDQHRLRLRLLRAPPGRPAAPRTAAVLLPLPGMDEWDDAWERFDKTRLLQIHTSLQYCTACRHRMAHRKWKESKQLPSMLPGTAAPGCCLVSFHFLWAILCPQAVQRYSSSLSQCFVTAVDESCDGLLGQ